MISSCLDEVTKIFMNINESITINLTDQQHVYMEWHRENLYKSSTKNLQNFKRLSQGD